MGRVTCQSMEQDLHAILLEMEVNHFCSHECIALCYFMNPDLNGAESFSNYIVDFGAQLVQSCSELFHIFEVMFVFVKAAQKICRTSILRCLQVWELLL